MTCSLAWLFLAVVALGVGGCSQKRPNMTEPGPTVVLGDQAAAVAHLGPEDQRPATAAAQMPGSNIPATLSLAMGGSDISLPAAVRLQAGADGSIELSASATSTAMTLTLRVAVPPGTERLQGTRFEFQSGFGVTNELVLLQGSLPDAEAKRSVAGVLEIRYLNEKIMDFSFDVALSANPIGDSERISARGTVSGGLSLVCLKYADVDAPGSVSANAGSASVITSDDAHNGPGCRVLYGMLGVN